MAVSYCGPSWPSHGAMGGDNPPVLTGGINSLDPHGGISSRMKVGKGERPSAAPWEESDSHVRGGSSRTTAPAHGSATRRRPSGDPPPGSAFVVDTMADQRVCVLHEPHLTTPSVQGQMDRNADRLIKA